MPYTEVMHKFKAGTLRSGGGGKVTSRKQAVAIMLSEKRAAKGGKEEYMQTRGTFPELYSGRKRANASGRYRKPDTGGFTGGFSVGGRGPRSGSNSTPRTLAGRRNASHAAARRGR